MRFDKHSELEGKHALLSPSSYHWIRYDEDKMAKRYVTALKARRGTEEHEFAHFAIRLGQRLQANRKTLNAYVNDAIGFHMSPEQPLYYSENCFGTADAIGLFTIPPSKRFSDSVLNILRIFDLKTGETPASFDQLLVYAALFCLEYGFKPFELDYDLRIYQTDDVEILDGDAVNPGDIAHIMDKIVTFDKLINEMRMEGIA